MTDPIKVANCSGFFGDRPSGALEMVEGGSIDVLTGDWLAELTMLILSRIQAKRPGSGYARTFVDQMEQVMGTCLDRNIKVVSNAGGLNPDGCAEAISEVAGRLGLNPKIAFVNGDDLMPTVADLISTGTLSAFEPGDRLRDPESYVTANAYLGCWGIVEALNQGADIVVTGRVTDAAVVCGPAAWHHNWERDDFDQLAGAVTAGHVIECSAQVTGGNYSFFHEIEDRLENARFGFPWAEIASDGSSVIGKHDNTGGVINTETVTSQLLYEIGGPEYLGPDVTTRFDSIAVSDIAPNRVQIAPVVGQAPPATLKVAMNSLGGYRNSFSVALTGLDVDHKADFAQAAFWDACEYQASDFDSITSRVIHTNKPDPETQEEATAIWRVTVKDRDEKKVGRVFSNAMTHTALAGIPGMYALSGGPTPATPFGVYQPALVPAELVPSYVHMDDKTVQIPSAGPAGAAAIVSVAEVGPYDNSGETTLAALGTVFGTRSGDKGGHANLGIYARSDEGWAWLDNTLTTERLKELLPEAADLTIDRYRYPNLRSLNFLIRELLEEGVAASTRQDAQAKAVGEWLRAKVVPIPNSVLNLSS